MKKCCVTKYNCNEKLKKCYDLLLFESNLEFKDYCFIMNFIIEIIEDNIELGNYIDKQLVKEK